MLPQQAFQSSFPEILPRFLPEGINLLPPRGPSEDVAWKGPPRRQVDDEALAIPTGEVGEGSTLDLLFYATSAREVDGQLRLVGRQYIHNQWQRAVVALKERWYTVYIIAGT